MLGQSVIGCSGQAWKFYLAIGALLFGSFVPLYEASGISWTAGSFIAVGGYIFGLAAIRCPQCSSAWTWEAAKDVALYKPLFTVATCPACGHDYGEE